ncbi:inner membrane complex protein 1i, putative [Plasmodium gallinaceum]|uniref:Inner membrane complex protein 1i, putative n=1 Tax=Plasmodium gallinaceum TaxID=5849 RepID=A0A1J1GMI5_PLAGA|nr:inner membrane complex protein 1i, putative [Plasmodium gallinaceum]CRG93461.1 inner membrane complex protein 1i, putative [Plasmodium gallinaceum]
MEGETGNFPSNIPYSFEHSKNISKQILKPIRQEKIVKVPVTQYIEKIIEKEQVKYVNKYVDVIKPIITYKTKHIPKPIYLDKIKYEPKLIEKEKIIHIPKIEYRNKVVEIPVYVHKEKIIEKKVPLVIERVVPVLKIKKIEKEVLTNTVEIPEISEITKNEMNIKISKNSYESNKEILSKVPIKKNTYALDLKNSKEDVYIPETSRRYESLNDPIMYSSMQVHHSEIDQLKAQKLNNGNSNTTSEEGSYKDRLYNKNETGYHDATNDDVNSNLISDNENRINNTEINSKEYVKNMEENYYNIEELHKNFNTTHVSIHLPTTQNVVQESIEQSYMNSYDNNCNISMNHIIDNNCINDNGNTPNRYNEDSMKAITNEKLIHESCNGSKRYSSIPIQENSHGNYRAITGDHIEMEQKSVNPSNMHFSYENYALSQNIYGQRSIPSKSNFKPSYANSNGQAFVSVRPATIVELKPKPRKNKTSICNFINNCCGRNDL